MAFRKSKRLITKPQLPVIDWSDPVNKACVGMWIVAGQQKILLSNQPITVMPDLTGRNKVATAYGGTNLTTDNDVFGPTLRSDVLGISFSPGVGTTLNPPSLSGNYTLAFWFKPTASGGGPAIVFSRAPSDTSFDAQWSPTGFHCDIGTGSGWTNTNFNSSNAMPYGFWYHFALSVSTTSASLLINGKVISTISYGATNNLLYDATHNLIIGGYASENGPVAFYDNIRIWERTLPASELLRLYQEPFAGLVAPRRRITSPAAGAPGNTTGTIGASVKKAVAAVAATSAVPNTTGTLGGGFTRASVGTYFDATGTLQSAAVDTPRRDHNPVSLADLGWLIETASTNFVTNPRAEGTAGALPTNWAFPGANTLTVVGTGTESGVPYLEVRYQGSTPGAAFWNFEQAATIPGVPNQTWTQSVYCSLVSGSLSNVTFQSGIFTRNSTGVPTLVGGVSSPFTPVVAALAGQRQVYTYTITETGVNFVRPRFVVTIAGAFDFTVRIGAPQLEQRSSASSVILPPAASPGVTTRAADLGYPQDGFEAVLKKLTSNVSGAIGERATLTATTKKPGAVVAGAIGERASITASTKKPLASVAGTSALPNETGTVSATVKKSVAVVAASVGEVGTLTASTKRPTASVAGTSAVPNTTGTVAASVKKSLANLAGASAAPNNTTGTVAATAKKATASVAGTSAVPSTTGTVAASTKKPVALVAGAIGERATLAASTKKPLASLAGTAAIPGTTGTVAASIKKSLASLAGTSAAPNNTTGTVGATAKKPVASWTASALVPNETGTIGATTKKLTVNLQASVGERASIAATTKKPVAVVSGLSIGFVGTVSASVKKPTASLSATSAVPNTTGTVSASMKRLVAVLGASVGERGSITATTKKPVASFLLAAPFTSLAAARTWTVRAENRIRAVTGAAPVSTFSRASVATYFDALGVLQTAAINQERFTFNPTRPFLESASKNWIRNPRAEGAIAGAPGTNPIQGWSFGSAGGIAKQVIGTGTINGVPYVDARLVGTVTTPAQLYINCTFDSGIACLVGQRFTASMWLQVLSDLSQTPVPSYTFTMVQSPSTAYLVGPAMTAASLATWSRRSFSSITNNGAMTSIAFSLWSGGASSIVGRTVDITLRFGLPQLEFGTAVATSPILPPVGSPGASTRASDFLRIAADRYKVVAAESRYHVVRTSP